MHYIIIIFSFENNNGLMISATTKCNRYMHRDNIEKMMMMFFLFIHWHDWPFNDNDDDDVMCFFSYTLYDYNNDFTNNQIKWCLLLWAAYIWCTYGFINVTYKHQTHTLFISSSSSLNHETNRFFVAWLHPKWNHLAVEKKTDRFSFFFDFTATNNNNKEYFSQLNSQSIWFGFFSPTIFIMIMIMMIIIVKTCKI